MDIKEVEKYLFGFNDKLTSKEIEKRFTGLREVSVFNNFSEELIYKMAMGYRENEIPPEIHSFILKYGTDMMSKRFDLKNMISKLIWDRLFTHFQNEGLLFIKNFFETFYEEASKDTSKIKRKETLTFMLLFIERFIEPNGDPILEFEIIKHRKYLEEYKNYLKQELDNLESSQPTTTKSDILKNNLQKEGFYNLEKVEVLTESNQNELIKLISKSMAYGIAMFDYLGFCEFLDNEKGAKYKANHVLTKLFNEKAKDGTTARHYRNSLINNNSRYTSYLHKEEVINDYEQLK